MTTDSSKLLCCCACYWFGQRCKTEHSTVAYNRPGANQGKEQKMRSALITIAIMLAVALFVWRAIVEPVKNYTEQRTAEIQRVLDKAK